MGNFVSVRVDRGDLLRAEAGVRSIGEQSGLYIKETAEGGAQTAGHTMQRLAPRGKTGGLRARINWDEQADFRPGGAGGGGTWVAAAGVLDTGHQGEYVLSLLTGTGEEFVGHDDVPEFTAGAGTIRPGPGRVFPIDTPLGTVFRMSQRGMRPRSAWWDDAKVAANAHVAERVRSFDAAINARTPIR